VTITSESGTCRYCHARLLWVDTQNGKRIPLDLDPERAYVLDSGSSPMVARQRNVFTCHFDTCTTKGPKP
jgi:hypothetical protein